MLRLCNIPGGCTPGIANREENFKDKKQKVKDIAAFKINLACEVRETLARLGIKSLNDLISKRN